MNHPTTSRSDDLRRLTILAERLASVLILRRQDVFPADIGLEPDPNRAAFANHTLHRQGISPSKMPHPDPATAGRQDVSGTRHLEKTPDASEGSASAPRSCEIEEYVDGKRLRLRVRRSS